MSGVLDDPLRPAGASSARVAPRAAEKLIARPQPAWRSAVRRMAGLVGLNQSTSLARRFLLASLAVLVVGGLMIGWWVGGQLERGIIDRTASVTGLYVESFIQPHIESLTAGAWLKDADKTELDALLTDTSFGQQIVALKVWRPDGTIVYSPERDLIGQQFPIDEKLGNALNGNVVANMSDLDASENVSEQARGFNRLLEMYLPIRERGGERIIGVAEFYQLPTAIDQEVAGAQLRSWLVVAIAIAATYLLLYGIVRQGSNTIRTQQVELQQQVTELSTLLDQNEQLRNRVRVAAERNTTLSERHLRRISSDLHDGPGQMLALAMLRLDQLRTPGANAGPDATADELETTLTDALRDMRSIAAGLRLPELTSLSPADTVRRAVDDHVRRAGVPVALEVDDAPTNATLPTKIALFRAAQELLSNSTRHGEGRDVTVELAGDNGELELTVSDSGPGLDHSRVGQEGHLGLAGIREQAELLGGGFEIGERAGGGARVTVRWPL